jgi:recombination protein RecA
MSELEALLKQKYKSLKTGHEIPTIERMSTGMLTLDIMLGGGLPKGRIIELFGIEGGGKTSTSLMMCKAVQLQGESAVLIDLERTLEKTLFDSIGVDPDKFYHLNPVYGEEAIDMALDAAEAGAKLIIIDSLAMLQPKAEQIKLDKDSEAMAMAALPGMMNRLKSKITLTIEKTGATLVFINQIRDKMTGYGGVQTPGGHAVRHMCSIRIQITHATKEKDKEGIITSYMTAIKNKTGTPNLSCSVIIENGVLNQNASLVEGAVEAGLLIKSGSWIKFNEELATELKLDKPNIAQGLTKAGDVIAQNPELYKMLYYTSLQRLGVYENQIPPYWRPNNG